MKKIEEHQKREVKMKRKIFLTGIISLSIGLGIIFTFFAVQDLVQAQYEDWLAVPNTNPQLLVRPGHPRLFVTPENLPALRCKAGIAGYESACPQFGSLQGIYNEMRAHADLLQTDSRAPYYHQVAALVYLISGDASFCNVPKRELDTLTSGTSYTSGEMTAAAPLSYDWCYPTFSSAQKTQYGNWFINFAQANQTVGGAGGSNAHPLAYSFFYPFAVFGDPAANNPIVGQVLKNYYDKYINYFIPAMNELSGDGATDGYAKKYVDGMRLPAEIFLTATNYTDMYQDSLFLQNSAKFWLSRMRGDRKFIRLPSKNVHGLIHPGGWPQLATRYNDPYAQTMAKYIFDNGLYQTWSTNDLGSTLTQEFQFFLWYEPWINASAFDSYPKVFQGVYSGVNFMRSDWDFGADSETILAGFFNTNVDPEFHKTQNHFTISRGEDSLLIDSGQRSGDGDYEWAYSQYYTRTIAHNSILIFNPAEDFGMFLVGGYSPGFAKSNDGGQCCYTNQGTRWPHAPTHGYRGEVKYFEDADSYTYIESDATPSYSSTKTNQVERVFVNLKPDIFVVFDRVNSLNASFPKRFLLHMIERPLLDGTITRTLAGQLNTGGVFESNNSSLATIKYGTSAVLSKTLLPQNKLIRLVGGKNAYNNPVYQNFRSSAVNTYSDSKSYEAYIPTDASYTNGINWTPEDDRPGNYPYNDGYRYGRNSAPTDEYGDWRIEVEPTSAQNFDNFLHVMQVREGDLYKDEEKATYQGSWDSVIKDYYAYGLFKNDAKKANASSSNKATWTFAIEQSGNYEVFAWLPKPASIINFATNAPYKITHSAGQTIVRASHQAGRADWFSLGIFNFNPGNAVIELSGDQAGNWVIADAVKLVYKDAPLSMVPAELITASNGNMVGSFINSDKIVMFSKSGALISTTTFDVNSSGVVDFLLFDMQPNAWYDVNTNGQAVIVTSGGSQYRSSSQGVLSFTKNLQGEPVNQPPVLSSIGNKQGAEAQLLDFTITASDPNGDNLNFPTPQNLPLGASFIDNGNNTATFSWVPDYEQAGSYPVRFEVSDGNLFDYEDIIITVNNTNRPPSFLSPLDTDYSVDEGDVLDIALAAQDPDATDTVQFSVTGNPAWLSITSNNPGNPANLQLRAAPGYNIAPVVSSVTIRATDNYGAFVEATLNITVNNVNRAPTINPVGNQAAQVNREFRLTVGAQDLDGDSLNFSPIILPSWLTLTNNGNNTATLSGTPRRANLGTHTVKIEASDGIAKATVQFTIRVQLRNIPPPDGGSTGVSDS